MCLIKSSNQGAIFGFCEIVLKGFKKYEILQDSHEGGGGGGGEKPLHLSPQRYCITVSILDPPALLGLNTRAPASFSYFRIEHPRVFFMITFKNSQFDRPKI